MASEHPTLRLGELPRLAVRRPDGKEVQHWLATKEITIGRGLTNRICIADPHVSKHHAKILFSGDSIVLTDLGSTNKTRVNGVEVDEACLTYGDFIQIAHVECRLLPPKMDARGSAPSHAVPLPSPSSTSPVTRAPAARRSELTVHLPPSRPTDSRNGSTGATRLPPPQARSPLFKLYWAGGVAILISLLLALALRVVMTPGQSPGAGSDAVPTTEAAESDDPVAPPEPPPSDDVSITRAEPVGVADSSENAWGHSVEFYFDEALSLIAAGRLKDARAHFERILAVEPGHRRAKSRLALLEEQMEREIETHFVNARQAFQFLRYEEAIAEWEMVMELADSTDPRHEESRNGIREARAKRQ